MKKSIILTAGICLAVNLVFSQSEADRLFTEADSLYALEKLPQAETAFYQTILAARRQADWPLCQRAVAEYALVRCDQGDYQGAIDTLQRWILFLGRQSGSHPFLQAKLFLVESYAQTRLGSDQGQLEACEHAIDLYETLDTVHSNVAFAYKNVGQILEMRLNYPKAIAYFEKAIANDPEERYAASVYSFLSDCYYWQEDYATAARYLQNGLQIPCRPDHRAMLYLSATGIYLATNALPKAEEYARLALKTMRENPAEDISEGPVYSSLAEVLHRQGRIQEASRYWDLALEATAQTYTRKHREHAKILVNAGDFFAETGRQRKALELYQQAIVQVYPDFQSLDPADNPSPDFDFVESWAMTAPARKAGLLVEEYERNGQPESLINAAHCYDLALRQMRFLKSTYGSETAKLYLGEYSHGYFEEAIRVQSRLYRLQADPVRLERIYQLMEESKAEVLREAIERNRALMSATAPDSLLLAEAELRASIAGVRQAMFTEQLREEESNEKELSQLRIQLADLQRAYQKVLDALQARDPRFVGLRTERTFAGLTHLQRQLASAEEVLLEYFYGRDSLYIFGLTAQNVYLQVLARDRQLEEAIESLVGYFSGAEASLADPAGYFQSAHHLYELLVPQAIRPELERSRSLIVIPDGPIGFVPFEALLTDPFTGSGYAQAPYLLRKTAVRYNWSAELLWQSSPANTAQAIVQFDPGFADGARGLAPLKLGAEETAALSRLQRLSGQQASLQAFLETAPTARLLHLSTHAKAGKDARVEFADAPLTLPQLYSLLLPAELVVLSACETNLGEFATGEGILSLARGFAYAGVASLLAAQWEINDASTTRVLAGFYEQLADGQSRVDALRQAKLNYLEQAPSAALQSPYYWAGLTFYGQDGEMDIFPVSWPWKWPVAGLLIAGGAAFLIRRRKSFFRTS